jgi:lipopolysaccharide export system permease protein
VARAAGLSAWQFIAPALILTFLLGIAATTLYNPISTMLRERSKRLEAEMSGNLPSILQQTGAMFWVRQRSADSQSILSATASREQGAWLGGVTAFRFDRAGRFVERIVAKNARLEPGRWLLQDARIYPTGAPPRDEAVYFLNTNMTLEQVRESFATPETLSFWELPSYIKIAEQAGLIAAGYRFQYHTLLAQPFLLLAMVVLAAAVSLRFFRAGGVQAMILSGIAAGFLLYVLSKLTGDLSRAELMHPVAAAWLPAGVGGLVGIVVLLYQEDG